MRESITVRFTLPVPARRIYDAWLDGQQHTAMTGARATASREVGGEFTAWDNYIRGKNLLLVENRKIVQSWRSIEFPDDAADSVLSIRLTEKHGITEVELVHADIPPGLSVQYQSGWVEYYVNPMQKYFARQNDQEVRQKKKSAGRKAPWKSGDHVGKKPKRRVVQKKSVAKARKKSGKVRSEGKK